MEEYNFKSLLISGFNLKRLIYTVILILALFYLAAFLYAYFYAEKIIFQPQPSSYRDTDKIIKLNSGDEAEISAVYLPNPDARYTILFSHGNAEDIGHLRPTLENIRDMGFSVFAYDYRGYGTSSGVATEAGAYRDAQAAYNYLVNDLKIPAKRIIVLGRSLGGAFAVDLAHRRELGGLIIESSFITAYRVLTRVPLFPLDKFKSLSKIKGVRCPVLVIHGTEDEVIPLWHGEKLFQEASEPKLSFWVENAGHNNLSQIAGGQYEQVLKEFERLIEKQ